MPHAARRTGLGRVAAPGRHGWPDGARRACGGPEVLLQLVTRFFRRGVEWWDEPHQIEVVGFDRRCSLTTKSAPRAAWDGPVRAVGASYDGTA